MFAANQYELIDAGAGRKLERFGPYLLDRPAPAAERTDKRFAELWREASARFTRTSGDRGQWEQRAEIPERWTVSHGLLAFELKLTPFGHVGVFPEQASNWDWLAARVTTFRERFGRAPKVLNAFAYTGGSTLAAAAAGAAMVHVDAAANVVAWARRNAELSGLCQAPIRWIVEDVRKFLAREARRGARYDAVVLDPPSYGHGPKGQAWNIERDLPGCLAVCELLLADERLVLLTHHSPSLSPPDVGAMDLLASAGSIRVETGQMQLLDRAGRALPSGDFVRYCTWRG